MGATAAKAMTKQLHRDIKSFAKQLEKGVGEAQRMMANRAIDVLLGNSPVWTGTYVKSFKASIGAPDFNHAPIIHNGLPPFPPRMPHAEADMLKKSLASVMKSKILKAKPFSRICISNGLPYAHKVEYTGWPEYGQPPHHVFLHAEVELAAHANDLNRFMRRRGLPYEPKD